MGSFTNYAQNTLRRATASAVGSIHGKDNPSHQSGGGNNLSSGSLLRQHHEELEGKFAATEDHAWVSLRRAEQEVLLHDVNDALASAVSHKTVLGRLSNAPSSLHHSSPYATSSSSASASAAVESAAAAAATTAVSSNINARAAAIYVTFDSMAAQRRCLDVLGPPPSLTGLALWRGRCGAVGAACGSLWGMICGGGKNFQQKAGYSSVPTNRASNSSGGLLDCGFGAPSGVIGDENESGSSEEFSSEEEQEEGQSKKDEADMAEVPMSIHDLKIQLRAAVLLLSPRGDPREFFRRYDRNGVRTKSPIPQLPIYLAPL